MDFELTGEEKDVKNAAREFAEGEFDAEYARRCDEEHIYPRDLIKKAAKEGFIGMNYEGTKEIHGEVLWKKGKGVLKWKRLGSWARASWAPELHRLPHSPDSMFRWWISRTSLFGGHLTR